jgi:DNA-binding transcriptional MocR family regulator
MIITNGCIEAVSLCLQAVATPGDTIVVESPTYPWFLQIIEDLSMLALEIPTDPQTGIDIDSLARALETNPVKACLMIPNFHNPLGCVMPEANKQALVDLLNQKGIALIEDDIHGELFHSQQRPSALKNYGREGLVLYCSTFSKTLAPGLRIGWTLPGRFKRWVQKLKLNLSIASSALNQHILATYLRDGAYDRHLRHLRTALKKQTDYMTKAIARYFPPGTRLTAPEGGPVLWVKLAEHIDGLNIFNEAQQQKIAIMPGCMCSTTGNYNNFIRLSCGWPWSQAIEKGMQILGAIIAAHQQN